jgi:hypothetical protein
LEAIQGSARKPSQTKLLPSAGSGAGSDYLNQLSSFKKRNTEFKALEKKKEMEKENHVILKKLIAISLGKTQTCAQSATKEYIKDWRDRAEYAQR